MNFEDVLPALRAGKKVRCPQWNKSSILVARDGRIEWEDGETPIFLASMLAEYVFGNDDWEIVEEPKPTKRVTLFAPILKYKHHDGYYCRGEWSTNKDSFLGDEEVGWESKEVEVDM